MNTRYEAYLHSLLEPEEKLNHGFKKRHKPTLFQKMELISKFREKIGEEDFQRMCNEYDEWLKRKLNNG